MDIFGSISLAALLTQILNGLTLGMILILIATGLTLIFGMMEVVNFAHGAFYMLGAYFGLTLAQTTGSFWSFWVALLVAPVLVGGTSLLVEQIGIKPLRGRDPLYHLLLTFGIALILRKVVEIFWGPDIHSLPTPELLRGPIQLFGVYYPKYRLFVLLFSAAVVALVGWFLQRTKYGIIIRAGTHDAEMVDALGINISRIFTGVFVFGSVLAAIAGVVVGPLGSVQPGMGMDVIINAFIVVIIGGLGSFKGAVIGGLVLGLAQVLGVLFIPSFADAAIYIVVVLVLLFKPTGLLGEAELK